MLETLRAALVEEARREAAARVEAAERAAAERVALARAEAERLTEKARQEGREETARATRRLRSEARRRAREQVLRARRDAVERLRSRSVEQLRENVTGRTAAELEQRLVRLARAQLGDDADIETGPGGGLVARADGRRVDYRIPALVDRALEEMGEEVEDLWQ